MKVLRNQVTAFRAGLLGRGMPRWCQINSLLVQSYRKGKAMSKKPYQIECGEWYFHGCYIQEGTHPMLFGKFEVFKDDEKQTHVGRYMKFSEAKKAAIENEVDAPKNGLKSYL